jgi:osmoprotectant transport system ATP-binding protein
MIELTHLYKIYPHEKTAVIDNVSLKIDQGEIFVILGSSGSGKSTLLKMINRLVEPTRGEIRINGQKIQQYDTVKLRRSIGYVLQKTGLFPHMTVEKNINIVLQLTKKSKQYCQQRSHDLLKRIDLDPTIYAQRYPSELSGGQSQRVGIARALATNPDILLMDEPFSALDAITRIDLQDTVLQLRHTMKKTIVFITHDIAEAMKLADRIAIMHHGKIEQVGRPIEIKDSPKTEFVKQLLSSQHY